MMPVLCFAHSHPGAMCNLLSCRVVAWETLALWSRRLLLLQGHGAAHDPAGPQICIIMQHSSIQGGCRALQWVPNSSSGRLVQEHPEDLLAMQLGTMWVALTIARQQTSYCFLGGSEIVCRLLACHHAHLQALLPCFWQCRLAIQCW
jgi:hypothetical protein